MRIFLYILAVVIGIGIAMYEKKSSGTTEKKIAEKLAQIETAQPADLSPEKLKSIFEFGSESTDLQRENATNQIKNKIIEWTVQVYEIKKTNKQNVYRVQTMSSSNMVGTFIMLHARNADDRTLINELKTKNWIRIKGVLTGETTLRNLEIDPAILLGEYNPESAKADAPAEESSPAAAPTPDKEKAPGDPLIEKMVKTYGENQARFIQQYRGSGLTGLALVTEIKTDVLGTGSQYYIWLNINGSKVQCSSPDMEKAAALNKGSYVKFTGTVSDITFGYLSMKDCKFE